jgi:hypothetical protein
MKRRRRIDTDLIKKCPKYREKATTILYEKHKRIIFNRAKSWSFHRTCKRDICLSFDDLVSIGHEVFLNCIDEWDQARGMFSTFLWASLNKRYFVEMNKNKPNHEEINANTIAIGTNGDSAESMTIFKNKMDGLSSNAQYIINSAINTPLSLVKHAIAETGRACISKRRIQRYLTAEEGWPIIHSWNAFDEIRQSLKK